MPAPSTLAPVEGNATADRVARYVDEQFQSNITAAAEAIGCRKDQLWRVVRGFTSRGPSADLLVKLHRHSGKSVDWWLTGKEA